MVERKAQKIDTCPSFRGGHLPGFGDVKQFRSLVAPHVESFNYFLDTGLSAGVEDIEPVELDVIDPQKLRDGDNVELSETSTIRIWFENPSIKKPVKSGQGSSALCPRECRERGLMYSGSLNAVFCYNIIQRRNGLELPGRPTRLSKSFGKMPIMVMSKACHLEGLPPKKLVEMKEEVR